MKSKITLLVGLLIAYTSLFGQVQTPDQLEIPLEP